MEKEIIYTVKWRFLQQFDTLWQTLDNQHLWKWIEISANKITHLYTSTCVYSEILEFFKSFTCYFCFCFAWHFTVYTNNYSLFFALNWTTNGIKPGRESWCRSSFLTSGSRASLTDWTRRPAPQPNFSVASLDRRAFMTKRRLSVICPPAWRDAFTCWTTRWSLFLKRYALMAS